MTQQVSDPTTTNRDGRLEYASPGTATASPIPKAGKAAFVVGWIITTIIILWMGVLGIVIQLFKPEIVQKGMADHGYPPNVGLPIFIVELLCLLLYAIPRTAVLGAILLTGYLGGAVATHVRVGEPWFMPAVFGVLVWLGIHLREPRLRELAPLRRL